MDDSTGDRFWDSSRLLLSLLEHGTPLLPKPPAKVLELGAGTGELAVALAARWAATLECYLATDLASRITHIRERFQSHPHLSKVLRAAPLQWGEPPPGEGDGYRARSRGSSETGRGSSLDGSDLDYDLVLAADCLFWQGGDIFERDSLEPLCNTLAAALENSRAVAIFAYRERWVEREAIFCELCRERGLAVISCDADLLTPHTPIAQADPDVKGLLRVLRIHRET